MERSQEQRVEELSKKVGGRFALTALVQKRMREYHTSGRAFMPRARNVDELFDIVLDQIESGLIRLRFPEERKELPPHEALFAPGEKGGQEETGKQ